jgi:hypothetical protein
VPAWSRCGKGARAGVIVKPCRKLAALLGGSWERGEEGRRGASAVCARSEVFRR